MDKTACSRVRKPDYTGVMGHSLTEAHYHSKEDQEGNLHRYCRTIVINNDKAHKFRGVKASKCEICNKIIK